VCGIYGSRVDDQGYSEYLVRWVGKSHHKNSWVDGQTLELLNAEFVSDFTAVHGERSTVHLVQEAWLRPQRVVSVSGQPPDCQLFVKWWGLPYKDCTWEALNAHPDFEHLLAMYSKFGCESVDKAQTNQEATAEKKATKVQSVRHRRRALALVARNLVRVRRRLFRGQRCRLSPR
jgi:hypothetical protein